MTMLCRGFRNILPCNFVFKGNSFRRLFVLQNTTYERVNKKTNNNNKINKKLGLHWFRLEYHSLQRDDN